MHSLLWSLSGGFLFYIQTHWNPFKHLNTPNLPSGCNNVFILVHCLHLSLQTLALIKQDQSRKDSSAVKECMLFLQRTRTGLSAPRSGSSNLPLHNPVPWGWMPSSFCEYLHSYVYTHAHVAWHMQKLNKNKNLGVCH